MAKRRKCHVFDGPSNDGSDDLDDDELLLSGNSLAADEYNEPSLDGTSDSDDSMNDCHAPINDALYQKYVKQCLKLKMLKKQLSDSLTYNDANKNPDGRPKVGFSGFSASTFYGVVKSLSPDRQDVIRKYGFGSLLLCLFCFRPR